MQPFPDRRRIYLMRHGEVSYFVGGQPVPTDEALLNDEGRLQAEAAARALADVPFDRTVVTGLPRTEETARLVLGSRRLPLEIVPQLREIRSRRLVDIPPDQLQDIFVNSLTRRLSAEGQFLGGETFGAFRERIIPAFDELVADATWHCMLIVAHSATNRVILGEVLGAGLENAAHIEQDAGCINIIDLHAGGYGIVRLLNFTPYNPSKFGMDLTVMEKYFLEIPGNGEDSTSR